MAAPVDDSKVGDSKGVASSRPPDRREQILEAAATLFARHGFEGVSVSDIAKAVGVTAPALYRHFESKHDLLVSILADTIDRLDEHMRETDDSLEALIGRLVGEVLDHPTTVVAYMRERHRLGGGDTVAQSHQERNFFKRMRRLITECRLDLSPEDVEARLVASLGVLRSLAEQRSQKSRPALDQFIGASILEMLRSDPGQPEREVQPESHAWSPAPSRREQIVAAALPMFRERGYSGVGIGEIGDVSGVGASNVARYFDSKDDILIDVFDRVGAQVDVAIAAAIASATGPIDALERMSRAYYLVASTASDLVVVVSQNRGALPASERPRLRRREQRNVDLWAAVVAECRPDLRPSDVAVMAASIRPLMTMAPQLGGELPNAAVVVQLVRAFVIGAR